ncbi:MAG: hypothetical protein EPO03_04430 [Porticoccaceae bacterium]|nr:hypothetical protein [Gammaproteobacteria bacterium]TAL07847.1 MAG: hypothetical protein EPO03_04430 [Porticoccaceae bacterium]
MSPATASPPVQLLFEPEFLPLLRVYGYLRLAGVAPQQAAGAVSRLQVTLAAHGGPDLRAWRRQILGDPAWSGRRPVAVTAAPAPTGPHFASQAQRRPVSDTAHD